MELTKEEQERLEQIKARLKEVHTEVGLPPQQWESQEAFDFQAHVRQDLRWLIARVEECALDIKPTHL